jgi:hypothetical protein
MWMGFELEDSGAWRTTIEGDPDRPSSAFFHTLSTTMSSTQRPIVFMDVNIGETPAGRLKMELFSDVVPKFVFLRHIGANVTTLTLPAT